jgi:hypothetical protein
MKIELEHDVLLDRDKGITVAHLAAKLGCLPKDYDDWELCGQFNNGETVAHVAAAQGCLPEGFDKWDLKNGLGQTVRTIYERRKSKNV